jgi:hypothetical protein
MWTPDPWRRVRELARWHVTTQVGARRNALLACTALARRRQEHDDVEQLLSRVDPPSTLTSTALPQTPRRPNADTDAEVDLTTQVARYPVMTVAVDLDDQVATSR